MIEKICSHCGTTLLVGLQYCPGCLRAIDGRVGKEFADPASELVSEPTDDGAVGADSFFLDLETIWANLVFPLKSCYCRLLGLPEPYSPPAIPVVYRGGDKARFAFKEPSANATLSLSAGYTRVVCPKCLCAQQAPLDLSPSDVITCRACMHPFPGSFAAEFRKGADLECFRCGVTTFCVSGLRVTTCPNCRFSTQRVTAKTRIKPRVLATVAALVFLAFFANSIINKTTTHFLVGLCVAIVSSAVGFVTLVALGF